MINDSFVMRPQKHHMVLKIGETGRAANEIDQGFSELSILALS